MSDAPTLAIFKLSESFGSVWADVAREAGATLLSIRPDDEPTESRSEARQRARVCDGTC